MYGVPLFTGNQIPPASTVSNIPFTAEAKFCPGIIGLLLFMAWVFSLSLHIVRDLNNHPPVAEDLLT